MLQLYTYFRSSAAYRVRIALALKGLELAAAPGLDRWLLALPAALLGWWLLAGWRRPCPRPTDCC
mgnify:CR=1 FL=1